MRLRARVLLVTLLLGLGACASSADLRAARLTRYDGAYPSIWETALATMRARFPIAYAVPEDHLIVSCWLDRGERSGPGRMRLEKLLGRVVVWIEPGPPWRVRVSEVVLAIHGGRGGSTVANDRVDTHDVEAVTLELHERLRGFAIATPAEAEAAPKQGFTRAVVVAPNDGCPGM